MPRLLNIYNLITVIALILLRPATSMAVLKIAHSSNMPPLSYIDKDGNPAGLLIELWTEWGRYAGEDIVFDLKDWQHAYNDSVNGKAEINAGLYYSAQRSQKLIFADYLFHMKGALFASKELADKKINLQEEICGVLKNGYAKQYMNQRHPYTQLMLFDSIEEMFKTAQDGRINFFVADYPVARNLLESMGMSEKYRHVKDLYIRELYPAVSLKNSALVLKINKFMAAIPKDKKQDLIKKWFSGSPRHPEISWKAAGLVTLVVLAAAFTLLRFRARRVKKN